MPRTLCATGYLRRSINNQTCTSTIWITDDLLAETFNSFARTHRRYGSHVPGPLEARRRATKRRNTNLAHIGSNSVPVDPAILFGSGQQSGWWQNDLTSTTPTSTTTTSILPSWLLGSKKKAQQAITAKVIPEPPFSSPHTDASRSILQRRAFKQELKQCEDVASVRGLLTKNEYNPAQHQSFVEAAFNRLLVLWTNQKVNTVELVDTLNDVSFSTASSTIHATFIEFLSRRRVSRSEWNSLLFPALANAIRLGMVSIEDIEEIVILLPQIYRKSGWASHSANCDLFADYQTIIGAVENSGVVRVEHLGETFIQQRYHDYLAVQTSLKSAEFISRFGIEAGRRESDVISDLLHHVLLDRTRQGQDMGSEINEFVRQLAKDLQAPVLVQTTQKVINAVVADKISLEVVDKWFHVLTSVAVDRVPEIGHSIWQESIKSQLGLTSLQNLLICAWSITYMSTNQIAVSKMLDSFGFRQTLKTAIEKESTPGKFDHVSRAIMSIDSLPLPHTRRLYWQIQQSLSPKMQQRSSTDKIVGDVNDLLGRNIRKLLDDKFYHRACQNEVDELCNLASSVNIDLELFETTAQNLIFKNKSTIKLIHRILEHNLPFKTAISIWPKHINQNNHPGQPTNLDPTEVNNLIHRLAIAFAISPVISARNAFRQVYKIYLYLHRYGAPILPNMSRAIWHAGVTRYGEDGAPTEQIKWCLSVVKKVEGQDVANKLLWSAGFRRERLKQTEHIQKATVYK